MPSYESGGAPQAKESGLPHSVENYLTHGAVEGARNKTLFAAAGQLRDIDMPLEEAEHCLLDRALNDGLSESESRAAIASAYAGPKREPAKSAGSAGRGSSKSASKSGNSPHSGKSEGNGGNRNKSESIFDTAGKMPLPDPVENGFVKLLETAFQEGEGVCVGGTFVNEDGERMPDGGVTITRERWLEKVKDREGDFGRLHTSKHGHYIRLNPMSLDKDSRNANTDVTDFRHLLVEFDTDANGKTIPKDKQYGAILSSGLPVTAVIDSGNKSLHAWVRVDAEDHEQYKERAEIVYELFGEELDGQNHNPNRYSRAPDGRRTVEGETRRQTLLRINAGAKGWEEWERRRRASVLPRQWSILGDLEDYDVENDPNNLLGDRWVCKGKNFVIVSQSGVGKSVMNMQLACGWALQREDMTFGIKSVKPLKQLIVQAENDQGDVAETWQKNSRAFNLTLEDKKVIDELVKVQLCDTVAGEDFLETLELLCQETQPDLCWIDPLLSYMDGDIKDASTVTNFCVRGLNRISALTGTAFALVHHTGKPPSDSRFKETMTASDMAYMGLGSSNLTNWAREVMVLMRQMTEAEANGDASAPPHFSLTATKRRKKAGMKFMPKDGDPIDSETTVAQIYTKHADDGSIRWIQCPEPDKPQKGRKKGAGKQEKAGSDRPPGRPPTLSPDQRREIVATAAEHGGRIPINVRTQLAEAMSKSPRTIANYVKKIEENAALAGVSPEEIVEQEIKTEKEIASKD